MMSLSDNQIIAAHARARGRQSQLEGGQWNNRQSQPMMNFGGKPGAGTFAGGGFNVSVRFNRSQILDERSKKYDRRGRKIDLFED